MGSCMSGQKQKGNMDFFRKDTNLVQKTQIYQPLCTTLFNCIRKLTDVILIFNDPVKAKQFSAVCLQEITSLGSKSVKMMYSFKKLIIVGNYDKIQHQIIQINKQASVTSIYVVGQKAFQKFQKQFAVFNSLSQIGQIQTSRIPILVYYSEQLVQPVPRQLCIFIHSVQQRDKHIYSKLRIEADGVIEPNSQQNVDGLISHYLQRLKGCRTSRIVLLHNKLINQSCLMEILSQYLIHLYETGQISTKQYLSRSLPNVVIANHSQLLAQQQPNIGNSQHQQTKPKSDLLQSSVNVFHKLFKQHLNQLNNAQKTQRAYNLLAKLSSNIVSNQNDDNYRRVKGANKQMEELLTRTKAGTRLLKQAGFTEKNGFWTNTLEIKYLKVLRTDMDLGFRNYVLQANPQQQ